MRSVSRFFGTIFQPIFHGIAWLLQYFYSWYPTTLPIVLQPSSCMGS